MLIYKLIGGGLLVFCGIWYPHVRARERSVALKQLNALAELVGFFRMNIEFYRMPMREILKRCDKKLTSCFGEEGDTLLSLFHQTRWSDNDVRAIADRFANELGKGYFSEQLRLCDNILAEIVSLRARKTEGETKKRKTEGALWFGATALTVILLL